jgi:hypothetical protein
VLQAKALGEQHRDDLKAAKKEADELAKKVPFSTVGRREGGLQPLACWEIG